MGQVQTNSSGELAAIDSSGNPILLEKNKGVTLGVGTYFFLLGGQDALISTTQLWWDGVVAGVATIETCSFPRVSADNAGAVTDFDTTGGFWIAQNPGTAYIPTAGSGGAISNGQVTISAGAVGSAEWDLGNLAAPRKRLKFVVSTGGKARCGVFGKD